LQEQSAEVTESLAKGQVSTSAIPGINSFNTEIAYKDTKYPFHVERLAADIYRLTVAGSVIDARVTETAEGALLATFGGEKHRIFGMEEPLGLRIVIDGVTILMYVRKLLACDSVSSKSNIFAPKQAYNFRSI
jgi:acetyl-CoA carboxylase/biotin carboxylase 1